MNDDNENWNSKTNQIEKIIPKDTENLIKEAELSLKQNQIYAKEEILKINNLLKLKYSLTKEERNEQKAISDIKENALQLNIVAQKQTSAIKDLINNQETEIKKLNEERILLDRNEIHLDIIKNQKLLIEDYKDNNHQLQSNLNELNKKLDNFTSENRKLLINNNELKNTISRYISHNKNLQKTIDQFKNIRSESLLDKSRIKEMLDQIKFYQDDNSRLSNELISLKEKYQIIKNNFDKTEKEKNNIFKQIQELNNSLSSTNILGTPFIKQKVNEENINSKVLNDISESNKNKEKEKEKEKLSLNNSLDKEIEDIFS